MRKMKRKCEGAASGWKLRLFAVTSCNCVKIFLLNFRIDDFRIQRNKRFSDGQLIILEQVY